MSESDREEQGKCRKGNKEKVANIFETGRAYAGLRENACAETNRIKIMLSNCR